jgi:putative transposase
LSYETISNITDAVAEEVAAWQTRPLEPIYPILYLDALVGLPMPCVLRAATT